MLEHQLILHRERVTFSCHCLILNVTGEVRFEFDIKLVYYVTQLKYAARLTD